MAFRGLPLTAILVDLAQQVFKLWPLLGSQGLSNPLTPLLTDLFIFGIEFLMQRLVVGSHIVEDGLKLLLLVWTQA